MGIEFRESVLLISPKNEREIAPGMVFNLSIAFRDLELDKVNDDKKKHYAVQLADTVIVNKEGRAELATNYPTVFTDVSYYLEVCFCFD